MYASQFYLTEPAIFLFVIGVQGSGKSTLCIAPIEQMPKVFSATTLSESSFLSGYGDVGILQYFQKETAHKTDSTIGHGTIAFSDFTPLLAQDLDTRNKVIGQIRRIGDGKFDRPTGKGSLTWKGKVTIIAGCTPVLEKYWSASRELGERFMMVKWRHGDISKYHEYFKKHRGREEDLKNKYEQLVLSFVDRSHFKPVNPEITKEIDTILYKLAVFIIKLQVHITRNSYSYRREIEDISDVGVPSRSYKAMVNLIRGLCTLFRTTTPTQFIYDCAFKLGMDTIPSNRFKVIKTLYYLQDQLDSKWVSERVIKQYLNMPSSSMERLLEDLKAIQVIKVGKGSDEEDYVKISPDYEDLKPYFVRYAVLEKEWETTD